MVGGPGRAVETVATSAADDNAFRALIDACRLSADLPEARIVGGQMVGILTLVYPDAPRVDRRTADADLGISTQIASSSILHDRLRNADYVATSGNHYELGEAQIDVLAPSPDGSFRSAVSGGRGIDLTPGLGLALSSAPVVVDLGITFLDGHHERTSVRVPRLEVAVLLKAFATTSRSAPKDYTDLYNLLSIAYRYGAEAIGGWRLDASDIIGARRDCATILHALADGASANPAIAGAHVEREEFVALIRELVFRERT
ncbi:hypothetical protein [Herbiconiux sp. A18JL235]|uniref:Nucleotidyl transferase AbiEii/AbiGii toxin family protein n=1 Tax=Herbiconiux sp. A18JL235 TaxID=3152363 RepID=A0AB39BGC6_9MICO